ncbi:MAG TPA: hypothetical protein VI670_25020 [Thermoanaerobaculia bacterium]|jgi:hypothetical protein
MSIAQRAGLPEPFQTTLLILAIVLALTPYLADVSIGILKVPKLTPRQRRSMKVIGPLAVAAAAVLVVPLPFFAPAPVLRLLVADATETGEIDLAIANEGKTAALLTRLQLEVSRDRGLRARPTLMPAATYRIPIDDLAVGASRGLMVRHLVPASATERIVIAPMTTRALDVRLRIESANGGVLEADVGLWPAGGRNRRRR